MYNKFVGKKYRLWTYSFYGYSTVRTSKRNSPHPESLSIRSTVTFYMIHPVLWYQAESDVRRHCFSSFQPALAVTAFLAFSLAHMAHSANTEFLSPAEAPARKAGRVHAHCARLRSPYAAQDKPFTSGSTNPDRKGCDILLKINYMSTLFVGIDVRSEIECGLCHGFWRKQVHLIHIR